MGGERFETMKPDAYLFGENEDLNFLGNKPTPVSAQILIRLAAVLFINLYYFKHHFAEGG